MIIDYEPGDKVTNPNNKDWGIGQVQSIINGKATINFQNVGKKVIITEKVKLERTYK
jgi:hypothetical protein